MGLLFVLPIIFGILGGATASRGQVAGQLGITSDVVRTLTSILYASFAGTPGMATFLRTTTLYINTYISSTRQALNEPLLSSNTGDGCLRFFDGQNLVNEDTLLHTVENVI